jgi:hypothetical protein
MWIQVAPAHTNVLGVYLLTVDRVSFPMLPIELSCVLDDLFADPLKQKPRIALNDLRYVEFPTVCISKVLLPGRNAFSLFFHPFHITSGVTQNRP